MFFYSCDLMSSSKGTSFDLFFHKSTVIIPKYDISIFVKNKFIFWFFFKSVWFFFWKKNSHLFWITWSMVSITFILSPFHFNIAGAMYFLQSYCIVFLLQQYKTAFRLLLSTLLLTFKLTMYIDILIIQSYGLIILPLFIHYTFLIYVKKYLYTKYK